MERNRVIGLSIDLAVFIISVVVLAYAWYLLSVLILQGALLQSIVQLQEQQQIYLYYITLALTAMLYYVTSALLGKPYSPTYRTLFDKKQLLWAIIFILIYIPGYIAGLIRMGIPPILTVVYAIPFAIVLGVMGLVENRFFIGTLGFGIKYELEKRDIRLSPILAAILVGLIATLWHLYMFVSLLVNAASLFVIIQVAISVFIFFFFGAIISFDNDNTWTWDIVHFMVNFAAGLLGAKGFIII
ncbi:MAG: hypothetical protein ACP5GJ_02600 [Nanopusillaceae archaeon]